MGYPLTPEYALLVGATLRGPPSGFAVLSKESTCCFCGDKPSREDPNCRLCGLLFCSVCSTKALLPEEFSEDGLPQRVCLGCRNACLRLAQREEKKLREEAPEIDLFRPPRKRFMDLRTCPDGSILIFPPQSVLELTFQKSCSLCFSSKKHLHLCRLCGEFSCDNCTSKAKGIPDMFWKSKDKPAVRICHDCKYFVSSSAVKLSQSEEDNALVSAGFRDLWTLPDPKYEILMRRLPEFQIHVGSLSPPSSRQTLIPQKKSTTSSSISSLSRKISSYLSSTFKSSSSGSMSGKFDSSFDGGPEDPTSLISVSKLHPDQIKELERKFESSLSSPENVFSKFKAFRWALSPASDPSRTSDALSSGISPINEEKTFELDESLLEITLVDFDSKSFRGQVTVTWASDLFSLYSKCKLENVLPSECQVSFFHNGVEIPQLCWSCVLVRFLESPLSVHVEMK